MPDTTQAMSLWAMTLNLWAQHGDWPTRRGALREGLQQLRPDVLMLQEAVVDDTYDQAVDLLGEGYDVVHQRFGLVGDGRPMARRWPVAGRSARSTRLTSI